MHRKRIYHLVNYKICKQLNKLLYVVWLDIADGYGYVLYALIQAAMDLFWIPGGVQ